MAKAWQSLPAVALLALASCGTLAAPSAAVPQTTTSLAAMPTPLAGAAQAPAAQVLLAPADLAGWTLNGAAGAQVHPGPGLSSATVRFTGGSGAAARQLYDRVSAFASAGAASAEFRQEQGDITRSSTPVSSNGPSLGQNVQLYSVDSGAGTGATSSVGILAQERNYLVSMVLSGSHGAVGVNDLWPPAQRQVVRIATAS